MKASKILFCTAAIVIAGAASALDTTVSNEFWCTWGYVNSSVAASDAAAVSSTPLNSRVVTAVEIDDPDAFSSFPVGTVLVVR